MNLGEVLKEIRLSKKITQVQVFEKAKVSQPFLSQLEAGIKNPSQKMLKKLCDLYGIPTQFVMWMAMTEADVQKKKLPAFRKLKPAVDNLIEEFLNA